MKIGIVTFETAPNHGAVFQAYALQQYLLKAGHEPFFIRWNRYETPPASQAKGWRSPLPRRPVRRLYGKLLRRKFIGFCTAHLRSSPVAYRSFEQLSAAPPEAGAYICGSDQVWSPRFVSPLSQPIAWLNFGPESTRRIAYAGSFGRQELEPEQQQRWSQYAMGLDAVSVREHEGIELMQALGRHDAQWVPDPTLLLSPEDYRAVGAAGTIADTKPYLFSYVVPPDGEIRVPYARSLARIRQLRGLSAWQCRPYARPVRDLIAGQVVGPDEWLARLRGSAFVITNSFHGLMFSLLFRRPFVVFLRSAAEAGLNGRVASILRVAGLEHRAVAQYDRAEVDRLGREEIDWDAVDARLEAFRQVGQRFLQTALA